VELRKHITLIIKWWWLAVLLILVTATTSYLVSRMLPPVFRATTVVIVGQSMQAADLSNQDILTSERLARTYADIAQRQPVLQGVIDTLNLGGTWQDLKERVQVQPVRDTQLLEITVEVNSPAEARLVADELASQLIRLSPAALQGKEEGEKQLAVRQRLENLEARMATGQERLAALEGEMADTQSVEQLQELQNEYDTLERLVTDWETNYTRLLTLSESRQSPSYLAVIQPAQVAPDPVRPRLLFNTLLAGAAGFFLALCAIYLLEYLDDTLKSADDLRRSLNLTPLGTVNQFQENLSNGRLITSQESFSEASESYRIIRSNIQFAAVDRSAKAILITSPGPGEGKSTTAANLGVVIAQTGLRTLIVDADLRRPVQHEIFQLINLGGLTDLLTSPGLEVKSYLRDTSVKNLQVMTSGFLPPNPSELLNSQRMRQLLADLHEVVDVVILDSPPVTAFADALVLSNWVDGVVLVTQAGHTRRELAQQAVTSLQQTGVNLFGGVLNRISSKNTGNRYRRYYAHYYGQRSDDGSGAGRREKRRHWLAFLRPHKQPGSARGSNGRGEPLLESTRDAPTTKEA
jgi:capsular exopolysaccharide synthesis family protein